VHPWFRLLLQSVELFSIDKSVMMCRSRRVRRSWRRRWRTWKVLWRTSTLLHSTSFSADDSTGQMASI